MGTRREGKRYVLAVAALAAVAALPFVATSASAEPAAVTFTGTTTIPVPPATTFQGSGGGDGWAVALSDTEVFNVFHHSASLTVACHLQSDASSCWAPKTVTQTEGDRVYGFATSGQPGLWLDRATAKLYVFATRSDGTGGVVCFDTAAADAGNDPFCGFTKLTGAGESAGANSTSGISAPVAVGSRWFAFNYFSGGTTGAENMLLCFDLATDAACANQPFAVQRSAGPVSADTFPSPAVAGISGRVIVPITVSGRDELDCFDGATLGDCAGWSSPVALGFGYASRAGAPFPLLSAVGAVTGFCLPTDGTPCYDLTGQSVATPNGLAAAMGRSSDGWNGAAFVLGPRVYVPNGNTNEVHCYDYSQGASCANFPRAFTDLGYLYTVNADPQRPTCIWVNADNGAHQIQNFDAFTAAACGEGPIRVLASSFVADAPKCFPGSFTSLQITSPAPAAYDPAKSTVQFADASGSALPSYPPVPLDGTGTADLTTLKLSSSQALPQFLVTLAGAGDRPVAITVKLTWTGVFDQSCAAKPGTTIVNPPAPAPTSPPPPPPKSDVSVTASSPVFARLGADTTFVDTLANAGPDESTGVVLTASVPTGATLVSAKLSNGNPCEAGGGGVTCFVGTLAAGGGATVTLVLHAGQTGALASTATAQADFDTNLGNNAATATTVVIDASALPPPPPAPAQPGSFNAIVFGTVLVNGVAQPADAVFVLKPGDTVDVTNGSITLVDSDGGIGTFSGARPTPRSTADAGAGGLPAEFTIDQEATPGAPVTLTLVGGDFSACTSVRTLAKKPKSPPTPVRALWGRAHGKFTTKARYSSATIRGTTWLTEDRCDGSLTAAVDDFVDVADFVRNTTVTLSPGQSYLASPLAPSRPAARGSSANTQTPASVRGKGLRWGGRTFKTKAAFTGWLSARGSSWSAFAASRPDLAQALADRS